MLRSFININPGWVIYPDVWEIGELGLALESSGRMHIFACKTINKVLLSEIVNLIAVSIEVGWKFR